MLNSAKLLAPVCLIVIAGCAPTAPPSALPPSTPPPPTPAAPEPTPAQLVLKEKLAELQQIRKTPEFKTYGIGAGGPYSDWESKLDRALAPYNLSFKEKLGAEELKALMREYVSSGGEDTKASEFFKKTVREASGN